MRPEGPFGEWTGYFAGERIDDPAVRVQRIYHRDAPILTVGSPSRPPFDDSLSKCIMKSSMIWDQIEKAGLPGVQGVWCHEAGVGRLFNIVSIKQAYHGHAKQAAFLVAGAHAGNFANRFVVVVDEDIDPTNTFDVLWAINTRCDPATHIDIHRRMWTSPLDPMTHGGKDLHNSRATIIACRPYEWRNEFPVVAEASPEMREQTLRKWGHVLAQAKTLGTT
jgi:4-hydroxy-3-polyprenylbenzoate decarboxylase